MKITSFDGLALSDYEIEDDTPLTFESNLTRLAGLAGAFDADGDDQRRQPITISRRLEIIESAYATVDTTLDSLKAKANLGLRWLKIEMRDGSTRGTWAKLRQISAPLRPEYYVYQPVELVFEVPWPWFEATADIWYLDAGETLDNSLNFDANYTTQSGAGTFTINNTGDDIITRGLITIAGASTKPKIVNDTTGESIQYNAILYSGETLVIDIGAETAKIANVSKWSDILLGTDQVRFFSLALGSNTLTFTGGGTLEVHWAKVY